MDYNRFFFFQWYANSCKLDHNFVFIWYKNHIWGITFKCYYHFVKNDLMDDCAYSNSYICIYVSETCLIFLFHFLYQLTIPCNVAIRLSGVEMPPKVRVHYHALQKTVRYVHWSHYWYLICCFILYPVNTKCQLDVV